MAITYDAPTDSIRVVGGSEASPYTLQDIYDADQAGGWGKVTKIDDGFKIDCNLWVGNKSGGIGYLLSKNEYCIITGDLEAYYTGYLKLGEIIDDRGTNGSYWKVGNGFPARIWGYFKAYGSILEGFGEIRGTATFTIVMVDCIVISGSLRGVTNWTVRRVTIYNGYLYGGGFTVAEDILVTHGTYGIFYPGNGVTKNITIESTVSLDIYILSATDAHIRDCVFDQARVYCNGAGRTMYEEYTFNFKATDKNGSGVSGVTVKAYKCGDYTGLTPNGEATPVIDTTTDVNGDIPEQYLIIWQKVNTTATSRNPFLFVLSHPDYPTKSFIATVPREKTTWVYNYAEEATGTHAQILDKLKKHDRKISGLVV